MRIVIFLVCLVLAFSFEFDSVQLSGKKHHIDAFRNFVRDHKKQFESPDHLKASFKKFSRNHDHIFDHQVNDPKADYGYTKFADMSPEEFHERHLTLPFDKIDRSSMPRLSEAMSLKQSRRQILGAGQELPKQFDWREKNIVGPVKEQHTCGSCWAFTTSAVLQSQYAKETGEIVDLSEQMLIDCDTINQGCKGGLMTDAYKFLKQTAGIEKTQDYGKYENHKSQCHYNKSKALFNVSDFYIVDQDENAIQKALYENGPLGIGIYGGNLQFYHGGIHDPEGCNSHNINHAVLLVGWGEENGQKYWTIKNQWGEKWGEKGYFRLARGKNACNVNTYASVAHIKINRK